MFSSSADTLVIYGLAYFMYFHSDVLVRLKDSLLLCLFWKDKHFVQW